MDFDQLNGQLSIAADKAEETTNGYVNIWLWLIHLSEDDNAWYWLIRTQSDVPGSEYPHWRLVTDHS